MSRHVMEAAAAKILERRLGPLAVLAKGAGRWSVILMRDERYGQGFTITDQCPTISRAVSQALQFAIEEHVGRSAWLSAWEGETLAVPTK
jgi:hypothetical protein